MDQDKKIKDLDIGLSTMLLLIAIFIAAFFIIGDRVDTRITDLETRVQILEKETL